MTHDARTNDAGSSQARSPRVLVLARYPVGGIRTWMEYIYGHAALADVALTMVLPQLEEAREMSRRFPGRHIEWRWAEASLADLGRTVRAEWRRGGYDLVHAHGFSAGATAALALPYRAPLIITGHDVIEQGQFSDWRGRLKRFALGLSLKRADIVHAVSAATAENLGANFPRLAAAKIAVVANGIDSRRFLDAVPEDPRTALGWPEDAFVIGFFGRFMNQKGFRVLLAALEALASRPGARPAHVLAVGTGGFRAREERHVAAQGLAGRVGFVDFRPDVSALVAGVDVVAMPSLWEASGLLAMEALAAGTPLVASDCPSLVDIASGSPARIVPRAETAALARALADERASPTRDAARAYAPLAARRFDVARTAEGIRGLYTALAGA